ncbi:hypothetical protein SAMN04488067_11051 [Halorubrum xinjiangense]|uniref:Uncharacterized protein n=1 Tax=Halorubrum xinjiangense TaxID=261291 RepID=A0A1G7PQV5_9EURY|nr:hypothetical protein [Halorubrum xinjiangense]SDF88601.1 hypothetical protein SAMN04488067_11051 [Halorubrum xinjiangense]
MRNNTTTANGQAREGEGPDSVDVGGERRRLPYRPPDADTTDAR